MRFIICLVVVFSLVGCMPNKTNVVQLDPTVAATMPHEVAVDAVVSFSKATAPHDEATCIFSEEGVRHEAGGELVPYSDAGFFAKNVAYSPVDWHTHIFLVRNSNGVAICDSMLAREYYGQENFERKFKWISTALMSLGAQYTPEQE